MNLVDWANESTRCLTIFLDGSDDPDTGVDGSPLIDDDFLLLVNSWKEPVEFVLPMVGRGPAWVTEIDTALLSGATRHHGRMTTKVGGRVLVSDFSLMVLRAG